ncbi:hypothetical protein E0Z10_g9521 [Xylaria hypoxylon]|uniref:Uncharacterized protein n=1 Tax=Xylaria hypoxylon TaxID=37992 RepID=A0A4Z0Y613_9PEZI|nr:hypothetical protein E0Z10_g9521 [Xylaria hypoxylon]
MSRPLPCGRCLIAMVKWTDGPKPVCEDTEIASNKCRRCKEAAKFCVKPTGVLESRSIMLAHVLASEVEHSDSVKSAQAAVKSFIQEMKVVAKYAQKMRTIAKLQRAVDVRIAQLKDIVAELKQTIDAEEDDPNEDIIVEFRQIVAAQSAQKKDFIFELIQIATTISTQPEDAITGAKQIVALIEQITVQRKASIAALSKLYNQVEPLDKE